MAGGVGICMEGGKGEVENYGAGGRMRRGGVGSGVG